MSTLNSGEEEVEEEDNDNEDADGEAEEDVKYTEVNEKEDSLRGKYVGFVYLCQ